MGTAVKENDSRKQTVAERLIAEQQRDRNSDQDSYISILFDGVPTESERDIIELCDRLGKTPADVDRDLAEIRNIREAIKSYPGMAGLFDELTAARRQAYGFGNRIERILETRFHDHVKELRSVMHELQRKFDAKQTAQERLKQLLAASDPLLTAVLERDRVTLQFEQPTTSEPKVLDLADARAADAAMRATLEKLKIQQEPTRRKLDLDLAKAVAAADSARDALQRAIVATPGNPDVRNRYNEPVVMVSDQSA